MIVKIEVKPRRDKRFAKQVIVSTIDKTILFEGENKEMIKKLDGSYKSYFLADVEVDPKDNTKRIVKLDARVKPQQW